MMNRYQFFARRDLGGRDSQQDDFGFYAPSAAWNPQVDGFLWVLADGMGGRQGGAKASQVAVEVFINAYCSIQGAVGYRLQQALHHANRQLAMEGEDPRYTGMGCTLVAATLSAGRLHWISVGDSPFWLWRAGQLRRLNADHSLRPVLAQQVQRGELTAEQAAQHPERNTLQSVLMGEAIPLIDYNQIAWQLQDILLLASDGLQTLSEAQISQIMRQQQQYSAQGIGESLLNAVPASEFQDNTTLIVIKPAAAPYRLGVVGLELLVLVAGSGWIIGQPAAFFATVQWLLMWF